MREHRYSMDMPHSAGAHVGADAGLPVVDQLRADGDPGRRPPSRRRRRQRAAAARGLQDAVGPPGHRAGVGHRRRVPRGYDYKMVGRPPARTRPARSRSRRSARTRPGCTSRSATTSTKAPFKWFEGPIYKFINKQNEQSMQALSDWLTSHPSQRHAFALVHAAHGTMGMGSADPHGSAESGHRAVAMDLPCEDPAANSSDYADTVVDALAGVGWHDIVVGHSLGERPSRRRQPPTGASPGLPGLRCSGRRGTAWPTAATFFYPT